MAILNGFQKGYYHHDYYLFGYVLGWWVFYESYLSLCCYFCFLFLFCVYYLHTVNERSIDQRGEVYLLRRGLV